MWDHRALMFASFDKYYGNKKWDNKFALWKKGLKKIPVKENSGSEWVMARHQASKGQKTVLTGEGDDIVWDDD
jgi:hypothetical protein